MRNILSSIILLFTSVQVFGQFSSEKLQVSLGYNVHNAYAKRFNHLIDDFNNSHYPLEIKDNLNNINWLHGMEGGLNYMFTDDIRFHAVLKSRRQFLETQYTEPAFYRQYLFRMHTLGLGGSMRLRDEGRFSHFVGAELVLGVMGVFTGWTDEQGYKGSAKMLNIDHTGVIGLGLNYEAQFRLHDNFSVYLRPSFQLSGNSQVRKLTDFFAPVLDDQGLRYDEGVDAKYDSGNLNGLGISGGLLFTLPKI